MAANLRHGVFFLFLVLAGCELTEVTLAELREVVVVEGLVQVSPLYPAPTFRFQDAVWVFLHRAQGGESADRRVPGALVTVTLNSSGETRELPERSGAEPCLIPENAAPRPSGMSGTCYGPLAELGIRAGERVDLRVELPEGGEIVGTTTVPAGFELQTPPDEATCWLPPGETVEVRWTGADDAWAYITEVTISGLRAALAGSGISVENDPLSLLGLAISARDTTIILPSELGVFDRFGLNRELAVLLQRGFPAPTDVEVAVVGTDRNYVNWVRGGDFNPSGAVRVPSVTGAGTGFFGSTVVQSFTALVRRERPTGGSAPQDCREVGR